MKTTLQLVCVLLLFTANTFAQKGFTLGFSLQPSMSTGGDYKIFEKATTNAKFISMEKDFTLVFKLGGEVGYNFTDKYGITAGVHYSNQGQKFEDYDYVEGYEIVTFHKNISLSYLKIPIQFHFISDYNQKLTYFLSAGIYMGFLTNYTDSNLFTVTDGSAFSSVATDDKCTQKIIDDFGTSSATANFTEPPFNNFDFGGVVEAGLQFRLSSRISLPVSINYQFGFVDIKNKESNFRYNGITYDYWQNNFDNSPNATIDYRNSLLGIKIGLKINFPSKAPEKKNETKK